MDSGLVEQREMWRAWTVDGDTDEWTFMLLDSAAAAAGEVLFGSGEPLQDGGDAASLQRAIRSLEERSGTLPPDGALVSPVRLTVLTAAGNRRAEGYGRDVDATDMAALMWVEDVLRKTVTQAVGVWWCENYDPERLSAPRGAVIPSCLPLFAVHDVSGFDNDEEAIGAMPETRLVDPDDFRSLYDCVAMRVPGDHAMPAVHSLASADMSADAFMRELGCGSAVGGRRMLQAVLSAHTAAGVDIASGCYVSYSASQSDGMPCLCVTKDGTEYVFQRRGLRTAPRFGTPHADLADLPVDECHDEPGFR